MTKAEFETRLRERINDKLKITYLSDELDQYRNEACDLLALWLIERNDPAMIRGVIIHDGDPVQPDFIRFQGQAPAYREGGVWKTYSGSVSARYFHKPANVQYDDDVIPFPDQYMGTLLTATAMLALNRNENNLSQEWQLLDPVVQAILNAAGRK